MQTLAAHALLSPMRNINELYAGYRFDETTVTRTKAYQEAKHAACAVDTKLFGARADPILFAQDCYRIMNEQGWQIDGMVHTEQRIRQARPVLIGEPLTVRAWIEAFDPVPRGRMLHRVFEFMGQDGGVAVVSEILGIVPDPDRMGTGNKSKAGARPDPREGMEKLTKKTMTPDDVTGFSADAGNLIHFSTEFAEAAGYRMPLAQGLQTMVWMGGALAADGLTDELTLTARFLRPVFWDDTMQLWGRREAGRLVELRCLNDQKRLTAELDVLP